MELELFDSKTQTVRKFVPLKPGLVSMYVCGPTVQSSPHLGHLRSALAYDLLRRWLEANSYQVTMVRNVTDIDDKILVNAAEAKRDWKEFALEVESTFNNAYSALGILEPTHKPRATEHISDMVSLVQSLISKGHAYPAEDGSANVFFDTSSWASYGSLTNQKIENMEGEAEASFGRRNVNDFALFKAHKVDEPGSASWQTPWGMARPGWHIECSAMAKHFLGTAFDIHGGGLDLRFPHHENELAQSTANGDAFANFWSHNALVTINGQKMSKSLGNGVSVEELLAAGSWAAIRYWLSSAQYRSNIDYSPNSLSDAQAALDRISGFVKRAKLVTSVVQTQLPDAFVIAMDADLNVPAAVAVLHETVRAGNSALDAGEHAAVTAYLSQVTAMVDVLGLTLEQPKELSVELTVKIEVLIELRAEAKSNKDFAKADQIRAELTDLGVTLEDLPNQTIWSING
ncbi:MAG: cysteine--tRNA ligase [Actinomycetes bacterium]